MSSIKRWLYIDPSRSKKKERNKVKTSASFSHIYPIAETVPSEPGNHLVDSRSSECKDNNNTRVSSGETSHKATRSNGFLGSRTLNGGTHYKVNGSCHKTISRNNAVKNNDSKTLPISESQNNVVSRSKSSSDFDCEVKSSGRFHQNDNSASKKHLNGGFTNNDRGGGRRGITVPRREKGEVKEKVKLWNKIEEKQKTQNLPDVTKCPLVIANYSAVQSTKSGSVENNDRVVSNANGFTQGETGSKSNNRTVTDSMGYLKAGKKASQVPAGPFHEQQTGANTSKMHLVDNGNTVELDRRKGASSMGLSRSSADYDELPELAEDAGQMKSVDKTGTGNGSQGEAPSVESDSDGEQASSEYVEYFVHCNGTVIKQKNSSKDQAKPEQSGINTSCQLKNSTKVQSQIALSSPSSSKKDNFKTGPGESSTEGLMKQNSSSNKPLKQERPISEISRTEELNNHKLVMRPPGSYTNQNGFVGGHSESSYPNESQFEPRQSVFPPSQTEHLKPVPEGSLTSQNTCVGNQLQWSISAPEQGYPINKRGALLSSSTSDMVYHLEPRSEFDTLSVTENPQKGSKSRKLKSLFKSHSKDQAKLNKHISWGTINEHFDDYPVAANVRKINNPPVDNEDDEVFRSCALPKKSMSLNLTPGFLDDRAMVNTHFNLESPTSIGSASSLMQSSEDEFSSCLDTLSNRSVDSDQQDSMLDTLSNHSWCSEPLDSSGCFTSSSLSQFSDYSDLPANKRSSNLDPRQTKSNLDLVEIMSTFSDILDVSLESLQCQMVQNGQFNKQWDCQSHSGLPSYQQDFGNRGLKPAVSFGCANELQKQCDTFKPASSAHSSIDFYGSKKWSDTRDVRGDQAMDHFSAECDNILGVSGLQRSDSSETITEEIVSDLEAQSEHLQSTIHEIEKLTMTKESLRKHDAVHTSRSASVGLDFTGRIDNNTNYREKCVPGNVDFNQFPVKQTSAVKSQSCYQLCQNSGDPVTDGISPSSAKDTSTFNEWPQNNTLSPAGAERSVVKQSLSVIERGGKTPPAVPPRNVKNMRKPRIMHSTSYASGLSKDPRPGWSSLQEALSELDPQFNLSNQVNGHASTENIEPVSKPHALTVHTNSQKDIPGDGGIAVDSQDALSIETVQRKDPGLINPSVTGYIDLNKSEPQRTNNRVLDERVNGSVVSAVCLELHTGPTEPGKNTESKFHPGQVPVLQGEHVHLRNRQQTNETSSSEKSVRVGNSLAIENLVPKSNDTKLFSDTNSDYDTLEMNCHNEVKSLYKLPANHQLLSHTEEESKKVSNMVVDKSLTRDKSERVNLQLSDPTTPTTHNSVKTTSGHFKPTSAGNSSMSLATLLRIRSGNIPSIDKNANRNNGGLRKFSMSSIEESTTDDVELKTNGSENEVAVVTNPLPEEMSPAEEQELDLLLQSLGCDRNKD